MPCKTTASARPRRRVAIAIAAATSALSFAYRTEAQPIRLRADALAQTDGGYAVEVVGADDIHRLVPVSLGLFDDADGMVQVTGAGLAAGQRVVVPTT